MIWVYPPTCLWTSRTTVPPVLEPEQGVLDTDSLPDFAECAQGRTFSTPFACAGPFKAMNECTKRE